MRHEKEDKSSKYPITPDGRYFVVKGRLWRCSNPALSEATRKELMSSLMATRRAKGVAIRNGDSVAREAARKAVDAAKHGLGERGDVWWQDGAPDLNRQLIEDTPYALWFARLKAQLE